MKKIKKVPALLIFIFAFGTAVIYNPSKSAAQSTSHRSLLALSKTNHTLAIVDPVTLKVLARVPVGPDPHEVIASTDGKTAYVSNMGNGGNEFHEMNVIDLVHQKALPNVDTKPFIGLHGLTFVGGKVWFTAQGAKSVGYYDPATAHIDWCMGTGQNRTHMIYVTPDEKKIYTTNVESGTVSILEYAIMPPPPMPMHPMPMNGKMLPDRKPHAEWTETVVPVFKGSEGFDVSPDGKELWTVSSNNGTIYIINTSDKKVTDTIDAKMLGANRLKFTPDGKRALISSLRTGDLFVYDVATHKELKRINIGHGGAGILIEPDGSRAFVGCTPDNYVAVIDLKKFEVIGHIDVGGGPDGLAWAVSEK
jgi:YVTN family beta-propeller protein